MVMAPAAVVVVVLEIRIDVLVGPRWQTCHASVSIPAQIWQTFPLMHCDQAYICGTSHGAPQSWWLVSAVVNMLVMIVVR